MERPPIVVVMGHVDHGKTSLLDYIRKTTVASREAGGITQAIGAYEIVHNAKKITFIDTPGHEAFSQMRARGAKVADLAILIVAADDGVQPQTKESIEMLNNSKTPFVVAINKIDKQNADQEKTKTSLMQNGVYLEGMGGNISWQAISAKQGTGINELLDLILLASEMEDLKYDPLANAQGIIVESKMDNKRGITAVAVLKNGTLKSGKHIATASASGKIKILENFLGERTEELIPSSPALILGFESLPKIGEEFTSGDIEINEYHKPELKEFKKQEIMTKEEAKKPALNLVIKADVTGSLEALSQIVSAMDQANVRINILSESVGEISDGDIKTAMADNAIVIGFNAKISKPAETLAKAQNIRIITDKIIYNLIKTIEDEVKAIEKPAPLGIMEILALFNQKSNKQLVGGKIISGIIKTNVMVKIIRDGEDAGSGRITTIHIGKNEVTLCDTGKECGIMIDSPVTIAVGDKIIYEAPKRTV